MTQEWRIRTFGQAGKLVVKLERRDGIMWRAVDWVGSYTLSEPCARIEIVLPRRRLRWMHPDTKTRIRAAVKKLKLVIARCEELDKLVEATMAQVAEEMKTL